MDIYIYSYASICKRKESDLKEVAHTTVGTLWSPEISAVADRAVQCLNAV